MSQTGSHEGIQVSPGKISHEQHRFYLNQGFTPSQCFYMPLQFDQYKMLCLTKSFERTDDRCT